MRVLVVRTQEQGRVRACEPAWVGARLLRPRAYECVFALVLASIRLYATLKIRSYSIQIIAEALTSSLDR